MNSFKFFLGETKYIISGAGFPVPATTPIGILKGYVDGGLVYNQCVPYRVIINRAEFESEVCNMTFNEYQILCRHSTMDIRLCGVVLTNDIIDGNRVYETWNGVDDRLVEYPSEFINNPEEHFFIEILKLPR